jgi:hexosaminidase
MGNSAWAQDVKSALLPMPNNIEVPSNEKPFKISSKANLIYVSHPSLKFCAETLTEIFKQRTSQVLPQNFSTTTEAKKAKIALIIDETLQGQEHYTLTVSRKGITITGATAAAVFYGIQTLDQVMLGDARSTL